MDQLIPVINWVKKNVFWIVCGVLTIALVTSWILVTNKLDAETKKNVNLYQTKVRTTTNIKGVNAEGVPDAAQAHPNDTTVAGMQNEINESVDVLIQAWQKRLDEQAKVRTWPKSLLKSDMFSKTFAAYDPPETFPVTNNGMQMRPLLTLYKDLIPSAMDRISAKIKTKWIHKDTKKVEKNEVDQDGNAQQADEGNGRGLQSNVSSGVDDGPEVVVWNEENQNLWNQKLTNFAGRDDNQMGEKVNIPSPLQVFMLQQDLWLLEAMFDTIAKVNTFEIKDADGNIEYKMADATDLAVIKRIDHIAFGREAQGQLGDIATPDKLLGRGQSATTAVASPSAPQQAQQNAPPGRTRKNRNTQKAGPSGDQLLTLDDLGEDEFSSPFHGRYVDTEFQPIKAEVVRTILAADKLPNTDLELLIARRIPVRVAFRMDERFVGKFIDECNKSPFTFEINQIRYNKHTPNEGIELAGVGSGYKEDAGDSDKKDGSDLGSSTGSLEGGDEGGATSDEDDALGKLASAETRTSYEVDVEFYGVIKLYNPIKSKEFLTGQQKPGQNVDAGSPKPGSILP